MTHIYVSLFCFLGMMSPAIAGTWNADQECAGIFVCMVT